MTKKMVDVFIKRAGGIAAIGVAIILLAVSISLGSAYSGGLGKLRILNGEYPRVFFFRQAEGQAAQTSVSYEQWEKTFERLMGIEGKVLEEEVPGRSIRKNILRVRNFRPFRPVCRSI